MNNSLNDEYTTDGYRYRTPSDPAIISALGRCFYNYLSLEESVVAIIYEEDNNSLSRTRKKMGGQKAVELANLRNRLNALGVSADVLNKLDAAIAIFRDVTKNCRNSLAHSIPFTFGYDEYGVYMPALHLKGSIHAITGAKELHDLAARIEEAINPLNEARLAVRNFMSK